MRCTTYNVVETKKGCSIQLAAAPIASQLARAGLTMSDRITTRIPMILNNTVPVKRCSSTLVSLKGKGGVGH